VFSAKAGRGEPADLAQQRIFELIGQDLPDRERGAAEKIRPQIAKAQSIGTMGTDCMAERFGTVSGQCRHSGH
jgi:hypothetical protein